MSRGCTIWITGLSGAGKTTLARELERAFSSTGRDSNVLDGDILRTGLNSDLGFSDVDRAETVRRAGEVALMIANAGLVAIAALISPSERERARVRATHESAGSLFVEVFVDTPVDVCEARDCKGLYAQARAGKLENFTGIGAPYEAPSSPEIVCGTDSGAPSAVANEIVAYVHARDMGQFEAAHGR